MCFKTTGSDKEKEKYLNKWKIARLEMPSHYYPPHPHTLSHAHTQMHTYTLLFHGCCSSDQLHLHFTMHTSSCQHSPFSLSFCGLGFPSLLLNAHFPSSPFVSWSIPTLQLLISWLTWQLVNVAGIWGGTLEKAGLQMFVMQINRLTKTLSAQLIYTGKYKFHHHFQTCL